MEKSEKKKKKGDSKSPGGTEEISGAQSKEEMPTLLKNERQSMSSILHNQIKTLEELTQQLQGGEQKILNE